MLTVIHFAPSTLLVLVLLPRLFYAVYVCSKLVAFSPSLIAFDELFSCDCSSRHNFWRLYDTPNIRAKSKLKPNKINEKKVNSFASNFSHLLVLFSFWPVEFRSDVYVCSVQPKMRIQHKWRWLTIQQCWIYHNVVRTKWCAAVNSINGWSQMRHKTACFAWFSR